MTLQIQTYTDADFNGTFIADPVIPLAALNIRMMVRRHAADATVYLDLATDSGIFKVADTTDVIGKYTIAIAQSELSRMQVGDYVFSVIAYSSQQRTEIGRGTLTHSAGPTRFT